MNLLNTTGIFFLHQPKQIHINFSALSFNNSKLSLSTSRAHIQVFRQISGQPSRRPVNRFIVSNAAASSPSLSGSSDQYLDAGSQKNEEMVSEAEQDPMNLADSDSCFCEFQGVHIHHKVFDPHTLSDDVSVTSQDTQETQKTEFPMILLHGFGASVFSWNRVMKPLARLVRSKVLAFDRPAFGLTSRLLHPFSSTSTTNVAKPLNPYSMVYSVLTTLYFIDFLATQKAILVGHSAGCLVAVDSYFEAPERVAALILVAPAIFAPRPANTTGTKDNNKKGPKNKFLGRLVELSKAITGAVLRAIMGMASMLSSLYKKALAAFLRSSLGVMLVRMAIKKFGVTAVRNAWYDSKQVTDHVVEGYTKPLKAKGWDRALVEFTVATLTDNNGSEKKPPLSKRLQEIKCPVLIVTGDTDRIVPAWNAERLARAIPGSVFEVIKKCGHLPQEEKPDEFLSVVAKFLGDVFGGSQQQEQEMDLKFQGIAS
uniref:2-hydroxy-6-oxononadienedioate/2-hydroxy-6-oxononatrienedioate hydrolase n=1 Tax=Noccaea caerulescens TaxID=107243 RepID=A0A1J3IPS4_NOCCA